MEQNIENQLKAECESLRNLLGEKNEGSFERDLCSKVILLLDTPPLTILRLRKQLGLLANGDPAWKEVKHTRFDHTVGVAAKCLVVCDLINSRNDCRFKLTDTDVKELVIAAVLHDCGHLPLSHATERAFLSMRKTKRGVKHEERIIPLFLSRNQYFEKFRKIVEDEFKLSEDSFLRIAYIIDPEYCNKYISGDFILPKKAIQQLLVSEIDLDRLDYILRDSENLEYSPIVLLKSNIVRYLKYLVLEPAQIVLQATPEDNVELCIIDQDKSLESVFHLLVARVLLYKNIYFSEKVRSFEAVLTNTIESLLDNAVAFDPIQLVAMSDDDFISAYLDDRLVCVDDSDEKLKINKLIEILKSKRSKTYKLIKSYHDKDIEHPRLQEEFREKLNDRQYIASLKEQFIKCCSNDKVNLESKDIMLDVFNLKAGGSDLLVKKGNDYHILKNYMNGSNMHRLCTEKRLDVYLLADMDPSEIDRIGACIDKFFKKE